MARFCVSLPAGSGILFAVTVNQQTAQTKTSDLAIGQTVLVPIQG